jgi:membrane protein
VAAAIRVAGRPHVALARRVLARFGSADGGLLAAGIAYNTVLALIPLGLLASGLAGVLLNDPRSRAEFIAAIVSFAPPLSGVVDEIVSGLSGASASLSIVGLVLAGWGTSRLVVALESGIGQMDTSAVRRGLARRTARRLASVVILTAVLLGALVVGPALAVAVEMAGAAGVQRPLLETLLALVPPALTAIALALAYRLLPVIRPTWRAIAWPAIGGAISLVLLTRVFVFVAPRIFVANVVYGTLGAILVGLTWLDLVFTVILLGAAWVNERRVSFGIMDGPGDAKPTV